ncbi:carbohydrate ABC transporter permease [Vallitalea okinawensis]|uniref:carbohydrate ABC transporter permease n=1 Tax=Vallitalea okinawensis TaxID=2078660 RepID=UPI000CFD0D9C|nr:carbohydrate ABC transporter permease [Vallitalea okinawensis]
MNMKSRKDTVVTVVIYVIAAVALILSLYPLYFVIIASISSPVAVEAGQVYLFPVDLSWEGYIRVFQDSRLWIGYRNTIFYTIAGTSCSLLFTLPAAYALSRKDFKAGKIFMFFMTFTMFFNGGLIPTYLLIKNIGLYNTPWVMILPFCLNIYNLIITRTFFTRSIPSSLLEAAKIDGCGNFRFFISIVLPLSKAIIAVITLYYAVAQWNEYFKALIYIRDEELNTLQLVLRSILLEGETLSNSGGESAIQAKRIAGLMKYSIIVLASLPVIIIYPFMQKYFVQGVMIGAIKE